MPQQLVIKHVIVNVKTNIDDKVFLPSVTDLKFRYFCMKVRLTMYTICDY